MYEDDRVHALDLYGEIFDEVGNDNAVLQLLVSPTRQAVNLARAYDAKDRGQAESSPAYLNVIEDIRSQAEGLLPAMPEPDDAQLSLFGDPEQPARNENVFESFGFEFPADEDLDFEKDEPSDDLPDGLNFFPDEDSAGDTEPAPAPIQAPAAPAPAIPAEDVEEKTPEEELDDFANSVAAFLAGFEEAEAPAGETVPAAPVRSVPEEVPPVQEPPRPAEKEAPLWTIPAKPDAPAEPNVPEMKETVPNVAMLVLLTVLAVPVGLVCIGALLALAALALGLAVAALCVGFYGFVTAFTAFSVFADILLVFGLSLALVALGLLFFWVFIWLVAGVIPSLIRYICQFISKHSNKEVSV